MNMDQALTKYLTVRAVARALDMRENTVSEWKTTGIPHHQQLKLEAITAGELRADDEAWRPAEPRFSEEQYRDGRHKPNPLRPQGAA